MSVPERTVQRYENYLKVVISYRDYIKKEDVLKFTSSFDNVLNMSMVLFIIFFFLLYFIG